MRLEEEIKQSQFNSEHHKLILNIIYTFNWLEKPIKSLVSKYQLTIPQYNILRILKGAAPAPLSPQDIKKVMIHKKSDLTRMLDRLVGKNLISRKICPSNRRKMDISITEEGIKLLETINPQLKTVTEDKVAQFISESDARKANELIDKLRG